MWVLIFIIGLFFGLFSPLYGQTRAPLFSLKSDLVHTLHQAYNGALEWRMTPRAGIELHAVWKNFEPNGSPWFNGRRNVHYTELMVDSFSLFYGKRINQPKWEAIGANRPMTPASGYDPIALLQGRVAYRMSFQHPNGKWRWFLQPGVQFTYYQYWEINTQTIQNEIVSESDVFGNYPYYIRVDVSWRYMEQRREMREREHTFPGIHYAAGIARRFGQLELEAMGWGGINLNQPYEEALPDLAKGLLLEFQFRLGFLIGK